MESGTRLGPYEILEQLGAGGMGEVWLAEDTRLGRKVAIKVLPGEYAGDPERLARFEQEARSAAALNHPHIAVLHDIGHEDGVHFMVQEYLEGSSLRDLMDETPLGVADALRIAGEVAHGLAAAHSAGIVHRDIKPENIFVTRSGQTKVLDFGLAKRSVEELEDSATQLQTEAGMVMGTAPYMSPEQVEGRPVDHRSDIFSLGIVVHEMLAGERPFDSDSVAGIVSSILRDDPPPVTEANPRASDDVADLVLRCLARRAGDRYQSAGELAAALAKLPGDTVPTAPAPEQRAVVVLPFANRSGDPDNEYFSDGLTEEIIADLSRVSSLRTISRNSAMTLKGTTKDSPSLARDLGVSHLVTGSVRRSGNALRVTAELVEAQNDRPIWTEKYSGTMEDVFGIQEEIAEKIVAALELQLTESEEIRVRSRPVNNVLAYDSYLRARQEMNRWTPDGLRRALDLVTGALEIVGDNALLLATKGQIHWTTVNALLGPQHEGLAHAERLADRSLALDPECALGVSVRGLVGGLRGEVEMALENLHRAYELDSADTNASVELCRFCNAAGLTTHHPLVETLLTRDPLNHLTWFVASTTNSVTGRAEEAASAARRTMELAPAISPVHILAAWQIAETGARDEPIEILDRVSEALAGSVAGSWARFLAAALRGDRDAMRAAATEELEAVRVDHWAHTMVSGYAAAGLHEDALRWVEYCVDAGFINYPCLDEHDPFLGELRRQPEFRLLLDDLRPRWERAVDWSQQLALAP